MFIVRHVRADIARFERKTRTKQHLETKQEGSTVDDDTARE